MSNKCPKCGTKLSPLYMKQNCPKCDVNLIYYDLDKRLQADHEKAIKEQEALDKIILNVKTSAIGGVLQIIRLVLMFSPLGWMCLPMFTTNEGTIVTLIGFVMSIINGELSLDNLSYLLPVVTMVCIILFSLAVIISSLFSMGKKALIRNMIFSAVNTAVLLACVVLSIVFKAQISYGTIIVVVVYILEFLMHIWVEKAIATDTNPTSNDK